MMSYKLLIMSTLVSFLILFAGSFLSKKGESDRELQSPFECGCSVSGESRVQFSLHFYLVALVFIIFDVELIILFPFFLGSGSSSSVMMIFSFLVVLAVLSYGLISEWNQMLLEWVK